MGYREDGFLFFFLSRGPRLKGFDYLASLGGSISICFICSFFSFLLGLALLFGPRYAIDCGFLFFVLESGSQSIRFRVYEVSVCIAVEFCPGVRIS